MKGASTRLVRIVLVAVVAWAIYLVLDPYGLGWLVLPGALVATVGVALLRRARGRKERERERLEAAWSDAILSGPARREAMKELRAALEGEGDPATRARRTLILADLLDADGAHDEARALIDALEVDDFATVEAAMVRHARASIRLRAGDVEGARAVLGARPPRSGSEELDHRLKLLDAVVDAESGEHERALETVDRVRRLAGADEALALEAKVVRALVLDASGDGAEARAIFRAFSPELRDALFVVGFPRVRALIEAAARERVEAKGASSLA